MVQNWYYADGKQRLGPFTAVQLRQLAAAGRVQLATMVLKEGTQRWAPASSVRGLFPAAPQASIPPQPPAAQAGSIKGPFPRTPGPRPAAPPPPPQGGVLGEAKGLLKSVGKAIAARAQDAATSARKAAEAKAKSLARRATATQPADALPRRSKRRLWPWLAGTIAVVLFLGLCLSLAVIGLGIHSVSQIDWNKPANPQSAAVHETSLHASEHQALNPMLKDGRHNLLEGERPWEPVPKTARDRPDIRTWSSGRNALLIKGPVEDVTRVIVLIDVSAEEDRLTGLAMVVGLQQGLFSPDRFDEGMGLELLQWMGEQFTKFGSSNGEAVRAVREVGDVDIVLTVKKGSIVVQFRPKSASDDFTGPE